MLSVFPELLFLSPFAATLLRAAAAGVFLYAATAQMNNANTLSEVQMPILGKGAWIVWASIVFDLVVGTLLLVGAFTQIVTLVGMAGIAFAALIGPHYLARIPLSRGTVALTFIILLSFLLTGAGAFAFDLPL